MPDNRLLTGDPLQPCSTDLIAQFDSLRVGKPVPDGWRVLSGNMTDSTIARVAYRFEIEADGPPATQQCAACDRDAPAVPFVCDECHEANREAA